MFVQYNGTKMNKKYNYDYPQNRKIHRQLVEGDILMILRMTGYSRRYVHMVMKGERNNATILEAAKRVIASRKALLSESLIEQ